MLRGIVDSDNVFLDKNGEFQRIPTPEKKIYGKVWDRDFLKWFNKHIKQLKASMFYSEKDESIF